MSDLDKNMERVPSININLNAKREGLNSDTSCKKCNIDIDRNLEHNLECNCGTELENMFRELRETNARFEEYLKRYEEVYSLEKKEYESDKYSLEGFKIIEESMRLHKEYNTIIGRTGTAEELSYMINENKRRRDEYEKTKENILTQFGSDDTIDVVTNMIRINTIVGMIKQKVSECDD
jgi:hypothetical protein